MYFHFFLTRLTCIQWRSSTEQYSTVHCPNLQIREMSLGVCHSSIALFGVRLSDEGIISPSSSTLVGVPRFIFASVFIIQFK
jgi:hypothetical protein